MLASVFDAQTVEFFPQGGQAAVPLHLLVVDPEPAVRRVLDNLRESLSASGAEVVIGALPKVAVREVHLIQLFQNLIGNALKFRHPDRIPRVEISAARDQGFHVFSVADNGIGFDPRHATKIFDIFRRLHSAEEYPGSGMGLAICARIVSSHGGRIWTEASPGMGATFRFSLPIQDGDA